MKDVGKPSFGNSSHFDAISQLKVESCVPKPRNPSTDNGILKLKVNNETYGMFPENQLMSSGSNYSNFHQNSIPSSMNNSKNYMKGVNITQEFTDSIILKNISEPFQSNIRRMKRRAR